MAIVVQGSGHLGDFLRSKVEMSTEAVRKIFTCGGKDYAQSSGKFIVSELLLNYI